MSTPTPSTTPELNHLQQLQAMAEQSQNGGPLQLTEELVSPFNTVLTLTCATEIMTKVLNQRAAEADRLEAKVETFKDEIYLKFKESCC